ncbi:hypothetical protein [Pseudocitrobacter cyperus]|uniref:Uncharacterized protein n=1 Tax=Pseudocitrobacter cyperus TaxID=3112843 RepID=A0ABV0HGR4_9ENTR
MISRQDGVIHAAIIAAFLFALLQLAALTMIIQAINTNNEEREAVYQSNKLLVAEVHQLLSELETLKKQ